MTPLEFYKRFGRETSWYYSGGVFTISDYYKEWHVDKNQLRAICKMVEFVEANGGKDGLAKKAHNMKDGEVDEFICDGYPDLISKGDLLQTLDIIGDIL